MVRVVHKEEISIDYVNTRDTSTNRLTDKDRKVHHAPAGRRIYRIVAISFVLLCILQVAVNVTLRLYFFKTGNLTRNDNILEKLSADSYIKRGWVFFGSSLYFISSSKEPWLKSREFCQRRGADLVVINTVGEQDFIGQFYRLTWLGLMYQEELGDWEWVDGTPLTKSSSWSGSSCNLVHLGLVKLSSALVQFRFFRHFISRSGQSWPEVVCEMIEGILKHKPGGESIINEYARTKSLTDSRRRDMEHYYNAEDGSGYLAWRLKFVQKEASNGQKKAGRLPRTLTGGPIADRGCFREEDSQMTDSLRSEAIALMKHTADEGTVKRKMKQTFNYRQQMIHDPVKSSDIFLEFPRFLDVEGLIEQDFTLMFDEAISAKFLEKWPTIFKQKVLEQSRGLTQSEDLQYLLQNAQGPTEVENGKMKLITRRMLYDCLYKLVGISICISTGTSIQGFLDGITESLQPFLLAVGTQKSVWLRLGTLPPSAVSDCRFTSGGRLLFLRFAAAHQPLCSAGSDQI
ncbi:CD209 antigen [Oryzias melastigma]|uniref:CD209 antigen n=1 Tax=Oryzias melastigma TaxID=30732 RepID=A0A834CLS7_ORYME|nr:CD209 antigen [Oryzias melastigma]